MKTGEKTTENCAHEQLIIISRSSNGNKIVEEEIEWKTRYSIESIVLRSYNYCIAFACIHYIYSDILNLSFSHSLSRVVVWSRALFCVHVYLHILCQIFTTSYNFMSNALYFWSTHLLSVRIRDSIMGILYVTNFNCIVLYKICLNTSIKKHRFHRIE